ncbi:MerR family transcriptional regulator [Companilactobacillus mishanensis]|uniref:MerR family transcriptional regulator n=1 Tax=Companilactobacillus mishanensis TaxID=2486008 RepID=UPI001297B203|nr:MerR family transcriptional regulator [Companilactobacillus mishanensis]MQS90152.1 MerR family transcriptional regulator [Companilactobacillus mishanensis]
MEYSIKELANIAGVSTRTLRYYDSIDLLSPSGKTEAGYRIYQQPQVDKLQLIMFYRELDFKLEDIKRIFDDPNFVALQAMKNQYQLLMDKQRQLSKLLDTLDSTIKNYQGDTIMKNEDKFEVFKANKVVENEKLYGDEIRQKYGNAEVDQSNAQWKNMSLEQYQKMEAIEADMITKLKELSEDVDLDSQLAKDIYNDHKTWLEFSWTSYNKEMHRNLADMYAADARFAEYYDKKAGQPVAKLLNQVIYKYTK